MKHIAFILLMMVIGFIFSYIADYYAPRGIGVPYCLMALVSFGLAGYGIGDMIVRRYK